MREFDVLVQFCMAHLIRDVKFLLTLPSREDQAYGQRVRNALRDLFAVIHRREKMFDILGNAWQWCDNLCNNYPVAKDGSVSEDPGNPSVVGDKASRIVRGGSFFNHASNVRSAYRNDFVPPGRYEGLGFRVARTYP
jgi:formylglycine-generating enzyme required for sulfatase activity